MSVLSYGGEVLRQIGCAQLDVRLTAAVLCESGATPCIGRGVPRLIERTGGQKGVRPRQRGPRRLRSPPERFEEQDGAPRRAQRVGQIPRGGSGGGAEIGRASCRG